MGQIDREKQQSEQPPKEKRADKPQWLEVLKPHRYAKPWYEKTKFAQRCVKSFKAVNEDQPLALQNALLAVAKPLLAEGREAIKSRFLEDNDGAIYVGGYALIIDEIINSIFQQVTTSIPLAKDSPQLALVATGGYGRGNWRRNLILIFYS